MSGENLSRRYAADQRSSAIIRAREMRAKFFPPQLFSDPAWDVLLALFDTMSEGRPLTLVALARKTGHSANLVARWVDILHRYGLVDVERQPGNLIGSVVDLSPPGSAAMQTWLDSAMETR